MLNILRTGVGSPPSIFTIKYLKRFGIRVVGVDSDPLSVGFYFVDKAYCIPKAEDPAFIPTILKIVEKESIEAILPAVDEEIFVLSKDKNRFKNTLLFTPEYKSSFICFNKLETYKFFQKNKIPTVYTWNKEELPKKVKFPLIAKPISGRGSRNIFKINSKEELNFFKDYLKDSIFQEFIEGDEYTIDGLADFNNNLIIYTCRRRILTHSGISIKAEIERIEEVKDFIQTIVKKLKIIGPFNVQFFKTKEEKIKFIEINPRLAGGIALSEASGAKILENLIKLIKGENIDKEIKIRYGLIMLRFWEEKFISSWEKVEDAKSSIL